MMMRPRHILAIGRILALLLFLANSGFTVALHSCLMGGEACCESAMPMMGMHGSRQPYGSGTELLASGIACCTVSVAGGVNASPIMTEQSSEPGLQKTVVVAEMPVTLADADLSILAASRFLSHSSERVPPRSVETYVLNATFLI